MQSDKQKYTKAGSLNKLSLKRSNSDSTQSSLSSNFNQFTKKTNDKQENCSSYQSPLKENVSATTNTEDSLADFKSPKEEISIKPLLNKFKVDPDKVKKNILKTKSKTNIKSKKSTSNIKQPTLESSFFKPSSSNEKIIKESNQCPLCLKPFKDDTTCTNHMKTCASKNNISVKQLLDAKRLQDRQAEERKAMGLIAAPVLPERKKAFRSKNFSTGDDAQLQLVLAMSESLYEAKQMEEFEQAALLAGIPSECIKEMNEEERKMTLGNFGFTTNKSATEVPINRSKKRKLLGPTILQTRSKEDKDRVLTERIACILTGDDAFTQALDKSETLEEKSPTILKSQILRDIQQSNNKLWDRSRLTKKTNEFYVKELKSQLLKLSEQESESNNPANFSTQENERDNVNLSDSSVLYEPVDIDILVNQDEELNSLNDLSICSESLQNMNLEEGLMKNVISKWGEALNDSAASDVMIFVKNNKQIYGHKLVFHVQCPNILLDVETNTKSASPIKEKISWSDKDELAGLAFLEFIYCGSIVKYVGIFESNNLMTQVQNLARIYKVKDLFLYTRRKKKEVTNLENVKNSVNNKHDNPNSFQKQEIVFDTSKETSSTDPIKPVKESIPIHRNDRNLTESPDLFESENEEELIYNRNTQKFTANENNTNLDMLVDLMDEEKTQNPETCKLKEDAGVLSGSSSQQTIINLSPVSQKSLALMEEDIHEAITPPNSSPVKNISSEILNETSQKRTKSTIDINIETGVPARDMEKECDSIYTAVTPPRPTLDNTYLNKFIDKVRKENAKDIFDSDSEVETPEVQSKKRFINPFLKRARDDDDDSYAYLKNDGENHERRRRVISMLEEDVLKKQEEKKSLQEKILTSEYSNSKTLTNESSFTVKQSSLNVYAERNTEQTNRNNSMVIDSSASSPKVKLAECNKNENNDILLSDDEIEDITSNSTEMSRYSKYKKVNQANNSIDKYRNKLNFSTKQYKSKQVNNIESSKSKDPSNSSSSRYEKSLLESSKDEKTKVIIEDITLVSDSDDEQNKTTSPKKNTSNENKLNKKSEKNVSEPVSKTDDLIINPNNNSYVDIEDDTTFPLELANDSKQFCTSKIVNSTAVKEKSTSKIIDLSLDSDEENIQNDSTFPKELVDESDNSLKKKNSKPNELSAYLNEENEFLELEKINNEVLELTGGNKKVCDNFGKKERTYREKKDQIENTNIATKNTELKIASLSPISIISSPENYEFDNNVKEDNTGKYNKSKTVDTVKKISEKKNEINFDMIESTCFNDVEFNDDWITKSSEKKNERNSLNLSNSFSSKRKLNFEEKRTNLQEPRTLSPKPSTSQDALIFSPILSQKKHETPRKSSSKSNQKRKEVDKIHLHIRENVKISERKSMSNIDFLEKNLYSQNKSKFSNRHSADNETVTPPMEYSKLGTPELQKELKKFGLKPLRREKAKLMLRHIYNETHSQPQKRVTSPTSSSEDEEPPPKKKNVRSLKKKSSSTGSAVPKTIKNCPMIAEEMDFDEPEGINDNPVSIKDVCLKFIETNKSLYTKVLTYEPLPLECLHLMLKKSGIKCKMNTLMDLLDEQCITFQVQNVKGNRTKKKN